MKTLFIAIGCVIQLAGAAYAQRCLHGPGESPEEHARRLQALTATRAINTIQANQAGSAKRQYLQQHELATTPLAQRPGVSTSSFNFTPGADVVPGWEVTLDVTEAGDWFMIKDKTDPCGLAFVSNQSGLIYTAEPIR